MPISTMNFAALPTEGDPLMAGLIPAIQQGIALKYAKPNAQESLRSKQLANALSQVSVNYAVPMAEADLDMKQNQGDLIGQQALWYGPQAQSDISMKQKQGNLLDQQALWYGPQAQSTIGLQGAQTNLANRQASLPFGGHYPPGIGGQILGLEAVRQMYGENSPQYKQALESFNLGMDSDRSRINYQNALAQTMPVRYLTPTGKSIVEESNVGAGLMPTGSPWQPTLPQNTNNKQSTSGDLENSLTNSHDGNTQIQLPTNTPIQQGSDETIPSPPASPQDLSSQYALLRQKNTTDTDTRKRNLFATNIEKTLDNINVDDLVTYSGAKGMLKLGSDKLSSALGHASDDYSKYQKSLIAAEMLATQVRQFYGDSIQPSMLHRLQSLTNPSSWSNSPELAKNLFNQTKNILGQEMQTYRDALQNTGVYKGQDAKGIEQSLQISPEQGQKLLNAGVATKANQGFSQQQIQKMAQDAIAKGADPAMVQQRIQKIMSGDQ